MNVQNDKAVESTDLEIVSTRVFNAAPERLFALFGNPDHLIHWWGPVGFTTTIQEFDLRPGGRWHLTMGAPDGTEYAMEKEFVEVVAGARIVHDHLQEGHRFLMTMIFADHAQGTELTWRMRFADAAEFARVQPYIIPANEENFDRLGTYLAEQTGAEA